MVFKEISVKQINCKGNSRVCVGDLSGLMASIKGEGLLNPVTVSVPKDGKGFDLVAGNRRYQSFVKLGFKTIPCMVLEKSSDSELTLLNLAENLVRKDISPYEEGRYFSTLVQNHSFSVAELAVKCDRSKGYVQDAILVYENVPAEYKEKVVYQPGSKGVQGKGKLPITVVKVLAQLVNSLKLPKKETKELYTLVSSNKLNTSDILLYQRLRDSKKISVTDFMDLKDKIRVVRVNVPVFKDELEETMDQYNIGATESLKQVLYGNIGAFEKPF